MAVNFARPKVHLQKVEYLFSHFLKMLVQYLKYFLILQIITSCVIVVHCNLNTYNASDKNFSVQNELMFYRSSPFSGKIRNADRSNGTTRFTQYQNGLKNGPEEVYYQSGQLAIEQFYKNGKLSGKARSWREDGSDQMYAEFKNGAYHGDYWTWHANGKPYQYVRYENGQEKGRKIWRESGQIYANYLATETENLGLSGSKLCDPVQQQLKELGIEDDLQKK